MRSIFNKLFGHSPFIALQNHMNRVSDCVAKVQDLFEAFRKGDYDAIEKIAEEISELEHAADLTKNNLRNDLPKSLFLPVDRSNLLEILALQDSIADRAEDIGITLTLHRIEMRDEFREDFEAFLKKNLESFNVVKKVVQEFNQLIQSSFSGRVAEKVKSMIDDVAYKEHEADILQRKLLKNLFANEQNISHGSFIIWLEIFNSVASLSNLSEKLGNRIRMTLDHQ